MSRKERQSLLVKKKESRELKERRLKRRWDKDDAKAMENLLNDIKETVGLKSYIDLGYQDVDEAYAENKDTNPHHFHYYSSGMITYKKKYIHLYKVK